VDVGCHERRICAASRAHRQGIRDDLGRPAPRAATPQVTRRHPPRLAPTIPAEAPLPSSFVVVEPAERPDPSRLAAFDAQRRPPTLASHEETAAFYRPDAALIRAVNAAMIVGAPLLLTGEAGTGKTQVAYWLRSYLGLGPKDRLVS